jgi:hypothetical protein
MVSTTPNKRESGKRRLVVDRRRRPPARRARDDADSCLPRATAPLARFRPARTAPKHGCAAMGRAPSILAFDGAVRGGRELQAGAEQEEGDSSTAQTNVVQRASPPPLSTLVADAIHARPTNRPPHNPLLRQARATTHPSRARTPLQRAPARHKLKRTHQLLVVVCRIPPESSRPAQLALPVFLSRTRTHRRRRSSTGSSTSACATTSTPDRP